MATTITAATLTVTHTEEVSLNGYDQGSNNILTIDNITEVHKRIITVPTSERTIINMGTLIGAGMFVEADVKYIRITNLDDTNHAGLIFQNQADAEFSVKLDKGQSFIYNGDLSGGVLSTMDAVDNAGLTANTFGDLVSVTAIADTSAVDLEIFIAST
tara:strand:+ start:39 stop:512 length:474 start_codon:yes stop_codon:yes gene_type:complete